MKLKFLYLTVIAASVANWSNAANPVLVDSGGSGQFTTVQAAINSWCAGGSNAGETAPFVIKVKAGSGPYDEALTLDQTITGQGNIVGDLVIESDTPGTSVNFRLQKGPAGHDASLDDGFFIVQDQYNLTFNDIIFSRSISNAATQPMDELVRFDGFAADSTINKFSFKNCIFTESKTDGAPMVTTKAEALVPPPTRGGVDLGIVSPYSRLFQVSGEAGESWSVDLDNCVFYGSAVGNVFIRLSGTGAETLKIHNCLSAYSGADGINVGGNNPDAVIDITGTDHKNGPLNCTASIFPSLAGATYGNCFTIGNASPANVVDSMVVNMSNFIAYATSEVSPTSVRGVSGSHGQLNLKDGIISVPQYGIVDITRNPTVWERLTIHQNYTTGYAGYYGVAVTGSTPAEGSLTVRDSILCGLGTKFGNVLPALGIIVENSGLPTEGPDKITAVGGTEATVTQTDVITADPEFVSKDGLTASFMDVNASAYAIASSTNGALAGGADYVGTSSINTWTLY